MLLEAFNIVWNLFYTVTTNYILKCQENFDLLLLKLINGTRCILETITKNSSSFHSFALGQPHGVVSTVKQGCYDVKTMSCAFWDTTLSVIRRKV